MDDNSSGPRASDASASDASCAQKACASDCPLVGAARVELGDYLREGVFYRDNYADELVLHCTAENWPNDECRFVFPPGRQYRGIEPSRVDWCIMTIEGDATIWSAPWVPLSPPVHRSLEEGDVLRKDDTISCHTFRSTIVLRALDTGEETPHLICKGDARAVRTDSVVAYIQPDTCFHRVQEPLALDSGN